MRFALSAYDAYGYHRLCLAIGGVHTPVKKMSTMTKIFYIFSFVIIIKV